MAYLENVITEKTNFVAQTAVNLRARLGVDTDTMGVYPTAAYTRHNAQHKRNELSNDGEVDESEFWAAARQQSKECARAAYTLADQPIGLLRFINDFPKWQQGKLGQKREASWELSNLMSVDVGTASGDSTVVGIEKMVFAQPAQVTGYPIHFDVVSVKNGPLVMSIGWQIGALGLTSLDASDVEQQERIFVQQIGSLAIRQLRVSS